MLDTEIKNLGKWEAYKLNSSCSWRKAYGGRILHCFTSLAEDDPARFLRNTLCSKVFWPHDLAYYYIDYPHCPNCARKYRLLEKKVKSENG